MSFHSLRENQTGSALAIVLIAVVILGVIGAGVYLTKDGSKKSGGSSQQTNNVTPFKSVTATTTDGVKALFTDAKAGKYDAKCTYNDDSGNKSTIYISGEDKMRVDTTLDNKPGHLLRLGKTAYLWADGNDKGSTIPVTENSNSSTSTDKFADNVEKYKLNCESVRSLDASLFKVPSGVTFTDFSSQINSSSASSN